MHCPSKDDHTHFDRHLFDLAGGDDWKFVDKSTAETVSGTASVRLLSERGREGGYKVAEAGDNLRPRCERIDDPRIDCLRSDQYDYGELPRDS
jgi:hypothetical protein